MWSRLEFQTGWLYLNLDQFTPYSDGRYRQTVERGEARAAVIDPRKASPAPCAVPMLQGNGQDPSIFQVTSLTNTLIRTSMPCSAASVSVPQARTSTLRDVVQSCSSPLVLATSRVRSTTEEKDVSCSGLSAALLGVGGNLKVSEGTRMRTL